MRRRVLLTALVLAFAGMAQPRRGPARPPVRSPAARPGKALDSLNRMSPEQRRRLLQDLPPERRKRVEEQLERYNNLPANERAHLREQLERFRGLPSERQEAARRLFRRFNNFAEDRRGLLKEEFRTLQELEPADRRARINSDEFRSKYTLAEQQLLQDYAGLILPPE